jgi:hypothetical protein
MGPSFGTISNRAVSVQFTGYLFVASSPPESHSENVPRSGPYRTEVVLYSLLQSSLIDGNENIGRRGRI